MELVYLWVEDYKNIHRQGFNFSPRFECTFHDEYECDENGKEKLKDNCKLEITRNKNHESIFPDNINVTAIVGKNGSGKSGLLESIFSTLIGINNNNSDKKFIFLVNKYKVQGKKRITDDMLYYTNIDELIMSNEYKKSILPERDLFSLLIDYSIDFFDDERYRSIDVYTFDSKRPYIIEPNKFSQNKNNINIDLDNEKVQKRIIGYNKKIQQLSHAENIFFIPHKIIVRIDSRRVFVKENGKKKGLLGSYLNNAQSWDNIRELNNVYISSYSDNYINDDEHEKANNVDDFINELNESKLQFNQNYFKMNQTANNKLQGGLILNASEHSDNFLELLSKLPRYFLLDFETDKGIKYSSLSTGEKTIQKILYVLLDYIEQSKKSNFLILIDEVELYLHPSWQKKYVKYLIDLVNLYSDKKFHFIVSSHSPFILSDIPKENVIFLKDGKQDEKVNIDTFGANIHTLLSHGFFMEDGLMGEFAKGKINDVYDFLSKPNTRTNLTQTKAQEIINLIGEPLIKRQLEDIYNKKFKIKSKDEIIQELQNKIAELEKNQNDSN